MGVPDRPAGQQAMDEVGVKGLEVVPLRLGAMTEVPQLRNMAAIPAQIPLLFPGEQRAPLGALLVTHRQRTMQDHPVNAVGMLERRFGRDHCTGVVANEARLPDAERVEYRGHDVGIVGNGRRRVGHIGAAEAGQVDRDRAQAALGEGTHHPGELHAVGRRLVDQHHRPARAAFNVMQLPPAAIRIAFA